MCDGTTATPDVAQMPREALIELNNRSRWYSSQLWQIPFAYLGLTALAVGQVASKVSGTNPADLAVLRYVLLGSAVFGVFVVAHSILAAVAEYRAVRALQAVEKLCKIPKHLRARYRPTAIPMLMAITTGTIAYWFWWWTICQALPSSPIAG